MLMKNSTHFQSLESRRLLSSGSLTLSSGTLMSSSGRLTLSSGTTSPIFVSSGTLFLTQVGNDVTKTGTLVVKGTAADNSISVIRDGKWIKYNTGDGGIRIVDQSKVKRVLVEGGSGDDRIFIDNELLKACTVVGGNGDDRIDGNFGATLIGGAGNDRLFLHPPTVFRADRLRSSDELIIFGTSVAIGNGLLSGGDGNDTLVGNEFNDYAGGTGTDNGLIYLPDADPSILEEGKINGKTVTELFADATGLEGYGVQVGTGKDAVGLATYNLTKGI
jgi:hypothetical protein